ncbi:MAG TPA: CHAT domain-containing protein [Thermoanaerobaculia bacterium]|nr:CHAT domain-containing protein [Thermoanaerobaculia bacterium]
MSDRHPSAETLAAMAAGTLIRSEMPPLIAHLDACTSCRTAVAAARETLSEEPAMEERHGTGRWWLAAAAVLAVVIAGATMLLPRRDPMAQLAALAPRDARSVETRLSGGFPWAPYRGPMRAEGGRDPKTMKLVGVGGELTERADREQTADAQHAAGVALLMIAEPSAAVERLRKATAQAPGNARAWNDLAAALYAEAASHDRPSLYPEALGCADRALRLEPALAEARFNRALILESLGLTHQAAAAWKHYLAIDGGSPWAAEARRRLAHVDRETATSQFQRELPELERAAAARDAVAVRRLVTRHPQQSRAYGEGMWLGQWGEAVAAGDAARAARLLSMARVTGDAVAATNGESLLRDAVAAIDRGAPLADAHARYLHARIVYSRAQPKAAAPELQEAARGFAAAASPMQFVARHYAAAALYDQGRREVAREALEQLLSELASTPHYAAVRALAQWELGLCLMTDGDWSNARRTLEESEETFRRLGERAHAAFVQTLLADTLVALGRPDEAWKYRIRSFAALSAEGYADRLPVSIGAAARLELHDGHLEAAAALLRIEEAECRAPLREPLLADVLAREALLAVRTGDGAAAAIAREAESVALRVSDPELRARLVADAQVAAGAVALGSDPLRAKTLFTRAIETYRARQLPFHLREPYLLRSRAERRLGNDHAAARDLEEAILVLERHPVPVAGALVGTGVLDADAALFEDAIALALDRGDEALAFAYAERKRNDILRHAPRTVTAGELQQRLQRSGAAVLELVVLPSEVVAFCVTETGLHVVRQRKAREEVEALASSATALYDLLIRPLDDPLRAVRHLIVVPDRRLATVPFAALHDSAQRRFLVERMSVSLAESASALQNASAHHPRRVLLTALLSSGVRGDSVGLPGSRAEAGGLERIYDDASLLAGGETPFETFAAAAGRAQVLHIAGHTERQPASDDRAFVFGGRRITWSSIASTRLANAPVVVLAACETLRASADADARASSLGGGFLAAGASHVIGTLVPIADADAREIFLEIHRQLAAGAEPYDALRRVQLESVTTDVDGAWRAVSLLTSRIPGGAS